MLVCEIYETKQQPNTCYQMSNAYISGPTSSEAGHAKDVLSHLEGNTNLINAYLN